MGDNARKMICACGAVGEFTDEDRATLEKLFADGWRNVAGRWVCPKCGRAHKSESVSGNRETTAGGRRKVRRR